MVCLIATLLVLQDFLEGTAHVTVVGFVVPQSLHVPIECQAYILSLPLLLLLTPDQSSSFFQQLASYQAEDTHVLLDVEHLDKHVVSNQDSNDLPQ